MIFWKNWGHHNLVSRLTDLYKFYFFGFDMMCWQFFEKKKEIIPTFAIRAVNYSNNNILKVIGNEEKKKFIFYFSIWFYT